MRMVVEDGIGRHDANALVDLDYARRWAGNRHRPILQALTDDVLAALIIRATDYTEQRWQLAYDGQRSTSVQALSWPRAYVYDELGEAVIGVPDRLKRAVVELAERAKGLDRLISDPPAPYPVADADGAAADVTSGQMTSLRQKVGDLEVAKVFAGATPGSLRTVTSTTLAGVSIQEFPAVVALIRPLLRRGQGGVATTFVRF